MIASTRWRWRRRSLDQADGGEHLDGAGDRAGAGLQPLGQLAHRHRGALGEQQGGQHAGGHALQPVVNKDQCELLGDLLFVCPLAHRGPFQLRVFKNL